MKTVKTSELEGTALDYAVAVCEGWLPEDLFEFDEFDSPYYDGYEYSSDWSQAGPIIDSEEITFSIISGGFLAATIINDKGVYTGIARRKEYRIAAMSCYVASKLGDEVEIPDFITC